MQYVDAATFGRSGAKSLSGTFATDGLDSTTAEPRVMTQATRCKKLFVNKSVPV